MGNASGLFASADVFLIHHFIAGTVAFDRGRDRAKLWNDIVLCTIAFVLTGNDLFAGGYAWKRLEFAGVLYALCLCRTTALILPLFIRIATIAANCRSYLTLLVFAFERWAATAASAGGMNCNDLLAGSTLGNRSLFTRSALDLTLFTRDTAFWVIYILAYFDFIFARFWGLVLFTDGLPWATVPIDGFVCAFKIFLTLLAFAFPCRTLIISNELGFVKRLASRRDSDWCAAFASDQDLIISSGFHSFDDSDGTNAQFVDLVFVVFELGGDWPRFTDH